MSFPRYPAYKPSGVEWLGQVPDHWSVVPLARISSQPGTIFIDGDWVESKDLADEGIRYITTGNVGQGNYKEQGRGYISQSTFDRLRCTEVLPGDVLISRLNLPIGRACVAPDLGERVITSVDNVIVRPDDSYSRSYLAHMLSSASHFANMEILARGTTMQRISRSVLGQVRFAFPGFHEQKAIATFLDHETTKIDTLIAEQQRLIELLQEKRQAVISHAVTKGLNPHAPMKDSGVEWLGEVPEHWSIGKLSYVADVIDPNPSHRNPVYTDGGYPFISTVEFRPSGTIEFDTPRRVAEQTVLEQEGRCRFRKGSLAFSRKGTIGAVRELPSGLRFALLDYLCVINPSSACTSNFLQLYFASAACSKQLESMMRGAALPQVSVGDVRRMLLPCPPAKEQQEIVNYLLHLLAQFDMLIGVSAQSGALLQERRSALISAAVTGQIDVRGLVPEEVVA